MYDKVYQEGDMSMFIDEVTKYALVRHKNGKFAKHSVSNVQGARNMAKFAMIDSKNVDIVCKYWLAITDSY
jgi:hypothetical protein